MRSVREARLPLAPGAITGSGRWTESVTDKRRTQYWAGQVAVALFASKACAVFWGRHYYRQTRFRRDNSSFMPRVVPPKSGTTATVPTLVSSLMTMTTPRSLLLRQLARVMLS